MIDGTSTTVWACRSRFCLQRGPFWVRDLKIARLAADRHRARKFLGIWSHDAVIGPSRGQTLLGFLREMRLAPKTTIK
jgi:hypothetical protein